MLTLYLINGMEKSMKLQVIDLNPPGLGGEIISLTQILEEDEVLEATERGGAEFSIWGGLAFEARGKAAIESCDIEMFVSSPDKPRAAYKFLYNGLTGELQSANLSVNIPTLEDTIEEMLLSVSDFLDLDPEQLDMERIGEGLTHSDKAMTYFVYALRVAEDPESKLRVFLKAIASDPYFVSAYVNCAQLLLGEGRHGEAMRMLLRSESNLKGSPLEPDILNLLGVATMNMGMWDEAVKVWQRALSQQEDHIEALCNLGAAYSVQDMMAEAEAYYRKAISYDEDYPLAGFSLGRLLAHEERCDEAASAMRHYIELRPGDPWAYYILGSCMGILGKSEEAEFALAKATQLDPGGEPGNLALGELKPMGAYAP